MQSKKYTQSIAKPSNRFLLLFLLILFQQQSSAQIKIFGHWVMEKRFSGKIHNHPDKDGNFTWDGKSVHLKGLYNEVLAFQVILETGTSGIKGIELSVDALLNKTTGKLIGGNTLKYGPAGTIEILPSIIYM